VNCTALVLEAQQVKIPRSQLYSHFTQSILQQIHTQKFKKLCSEFMESIKQQGNNHITSQKSAL